MVEEFVVYVQGIKMLSPSSIKKFIRCPRSWYYRYVMGIQEKVNMAMFKGSVVHKVIEDFSSKYERDLEQRWRRIFEREWNKGTPAKKDIPPEELSKERADAERILNFYFQTFFTKMDVLIGAGKAKGAPHAFHLLKPKWKELDLRSKELGLRGYIDRADTSFSGAVTISDYKTSSKYGGQMNEDDEIQLMLYALLWKAIKEETPRHVAIHYLRYGESYFIKVTPWMIETAYELLKDVHSKTQTRDPMHYPIKINNLCDWCSYLQICLKDRTKTKEEWNVYLQKSKS